MTTHTYYLTGTAKWCKHEDRDEKFNRYSVDLYPDDDSWEKYDKTGAQLKIREDEDGKFIKIGRKHSTLTHSGEVREFGPPEAVQADGSPLEPGTKIGNGSNVTVKVSCYPTPNGMGTRWEKIRVNELIEYIPNEVIEDEDIDEPF